MTNPHPLSPAAQAVKDAPTRAAALQALVDQVVPHMEEPDWGACDQMNCDIELYTDHQRKRAEILAIVAELEGGKAQ